MLERFWKTITGLMALSAIVTILSWWYLHTSHTVLGKPTGVTQLLSLPTGFPSIWSIVRPSTANSWIAPLIVLILQVLVSGGFLGTLVRINARQPVSAASFVSDALRSFWRLLIWNVLWDAVSVLVADLMNVLAPLAVTLTIVLLLLRFLFFFGDIALVAERQLDFAKAIRTGMNSLVRGLIPMIPFAVIILVLTGAGLSMSAGVAPVLLLVTAVVYSVAMVWVLHMVVARYMYYSNWTAGSASERMAATD